MKCIYCSGKDTDVTNSRRIKGGTLTWRRRQCTNCKAIFTTKETPLIDNLFVIKRNGTRQRFLYEKLFVSLFNVLNAKKGSDNGENAKHAKKLAEQVIQRALLASSAEKNIPTSTLIPLAYSHLKRMDRSAAEQYIHYSSYRLGVALKSGLVRIPTI